MKHSLFYRKNLYIGNNVIYFIKSSKSYKHFEFIKSNLNFWLGLYPIIMQRIAEWFAGAARPILQNSDRKSFNQNKT